MEALQQQLQSIITASITGRVVRTEGMAISVAGFPVPVGARVQVARQSAAPIEGEVVGFRDGLTLVYPYSAIDGVRHGNEARLRRTSCSLLVGRELLGRVVNAHGKPIDGGPLAGCTERLAFDREPPLAVDRPPVQQGMTTGIRTIDALLTCGAGQRLGIFSGSGVGKSTLLGMVARYTSADVNVIALIGERGREVNEFLERDLGPEGLAKSVVVVATSDQPALLRVKAAMAATTLAEFFRDQGQQVLLLMDSLTRYALAQREIGLAAGEPPATRGFPPSVFASLPRLVERAGRAARGDITGLYTVLVEGDDTNEPISDTVRGLLDGHVVLSREIAARGHYPAIDVLASISRVMPALTETGHREAARDLRELMAVYREHEDLISIGAYRAGANPLVDVALHLRNDLNNFLQQSVDERSSLEAARLALLQLVNQSRSMLERVRSGQTSANQVA